MDAYVFLRTEPGRTRDVAGRAAGLAGDGIRQSVVITGEWDVMVALEVADPRRLGNVLMDQVLNDEAVAESHTAVVLKPPGTPPLPMPVRGIEEITCIVLAQLDPALGRENPGGMDAWVGGLYEALAATPGVVGAAMVTGEYDLIVEVGSDTWEGASAGIIGVAGLPGIAATSTAVAVTEKLVARESES